MHDPPYLAPRPFPVPPPDAAYIAISLKLADLGSDALTRHIGLLRMCVAAAQKRFGFSIEGGVVLPRDLHLL